MMTETVVSSFIGGFALQYLRDDESSHYGFQCLFSSVFELFLNMVSPNFGTLIRNFEAEE